jgi:hypothetical protein
MSTSPQFPDGSWLRHYIDVSRVLREQRELGPRGLSSAAVIANARICLAALVVQARDELGDKL